MWSDWLSKFLAIQSFPSFSTYILLFRIEDSDAKNLRGLTHHSSIRCVKETLKKRFDKNPNDFVGESL